MNYKITKLSKNDFPEKLRNIRNSPKNLYLIGNKELLYEECFGIVGTRRISEYGIENCKNFAKEFVFRNVPIVSGMAIGTDTVAHKTAIEYGGKTIAVLGSGFNNIFPKENIELFDKIIETNGLVVTEYEMDVEPTKENFPERNRIVTALSEGILVIEAAFRSGTSITANNAKAQGKKVFALPGKLDSSVGVGVNNMIKKGAILTTKIEDILNHYPQFADRLRITTTKKSYESENIKKEYKCIYKILKNEAKYLDEILEDTGLSINEVLKLLTKMELEGIIEHEITGKYEIIKKEGEK